MDHLLQLGQGDLPLFWTGLFVNKPVLLDYVSGAKEQKALARQAIATGAAGLLIITLDVFRQIVVHHKPHIGFIDAHAEGDGSTYHTYLIAQKQLLVAVDFLGGRTGVARPGAAAILNRTWRDALGGLG